MNTAVSATGMKVTAKAESGIVIANTNESSAVWAASAATTTAALQLLPTSTSGAATWYHNSSKSASVATGASYVGEYTTVTNDVTNSKYYYSENTFYIKSATTDSISSQLYVKDVTITLPETANSANLDKTIRILVKVGEFTKIYCLSGATETYVVGGTGGTEITALVATDAGSKNIAVTGQTTIPASTATPITAKVFIYFEGEDAACISNNVTASLDQIVVSVMFGTSTD